MTSPETLLPYPFVRSIGERYHMDQDDYIGNGQSATVFRATPVSAENSTEVAVKVIKKKSVELGDDEQDVVGFESDVMREVTSLAQLNHGHCIHLIDVCQTVSHVYIVTTLAPGRELFYCLQRRERYSEGEALGLLRQLLLAVQFLHERGMVHRDVKLENIIVTDTNFLTLIDFGLCKNWSENELSSNSHLPSTPCGSFKYTPPETLQHVLTFPNSTAENKPSRSFLELASGDMYSVGIVLHLLLSGTYPFETNTKRGGIAPLLKAIREGPKFEHKNFGATSEGAKELVRRLLSFDPSQRPSAEEILRSLPLYSGSRPQSITRCVLDAAPCLVASVSSGRTSPTQFIEVTS